jgi:acyl-[acyl-carrier-protein] desaturase
MLHHEQILVPVVMRHWAVDKLEGLTAEAEQARDRLIRKIERIGLLAKRMTDRAAEAQGLQLALA